MCVCIESLYSPHSLDERETEKGGEKWLAQNGTATAEQNITLRNTLLTVNRQHAQ